jgi:hypothetical protein
MKNEYYRPNDPRITYQGRGIKAERLENPDKKIKCDYNYCNRQAVQYVRVWFNRYFIRINHCAVHEYHFYEHQRYLKKIGLIDEK